jgi:hypothetical protein
MTPKQAARTAAHGRRLLTANILTPHDYAVLDTMLWRLRRPGRWDFAAPYQVIARLAGVCRDCAIGAVRKLELIGILTKRQDRVIVRWGLNRAQIASRQAANIYVFHSSSTESATQATSIGIERFYLDVDRVQGGKSAKPARPSALEAALGRLAGAAGLKLG